MSYKESVKKVVIKVGSSTLTHESGQADLAVISDLCWELCNLKDYGIQPVLVSSGSIVVGSKALNLREKPNTIAQRQAASSVGQALLMRTYNQSLKEHNYIGAQILLTKQIETDIVMRQNAINNFNELWNLDAIPIVNENDAISTFEIEFGDNDTLSAVVARMIDADLLIILSDVDGLYDSNPTTNPSAKKIDIVEKVSKDLMEVAEGPGTSKGTGGMTTKLNAAMLAMEKGIDTIIAKGDDMRVIRSIFNGENVGTLFKGVEKRC